MHTLLHLLAFVSISGSIAYYLYALTDTIIILIAVVAALYLISRIRAAQIPHSPFQYFLHNPSFTVLFIVYGALIAGAFTLLARAQIIDAVRAPWDRIPPSFFVLFFLTAFLCIVLVRRTYERNWLLALGIVQVFSFLFLSVAWVAFPIGYGFDSFIHQATEKVIATQGFITPKPFYYIGQYSLVVFLSKILFVPVEWVDKLLVPLLAALFIPWVVMTWLRRYSQKIETDKDEKDDSKNTVRILVRSDQITDSVLALCILLLPFILSQFTITTPQALGNVLLIILIFHIASNTKDITNWLIAFAILLIHPLAGIPAFIFLLFRSILPMKSYMLRVTCYMFAVLAIPAVFLLSSQFSSQIQIHFAPQNFLPWLQSIEWPGIYRENRFHAPLDLLYFYGFNIKNIFWFFVLTGTISWWKKRKIVTGYMLHVTCFLILLANYAIMSGLLSFQFLISYEQADYGRRVLEIAQFFLLPFFLLGFGWWINKLSTYFKTSPSPLLKGEGLVGVLRRGGSTVLLAALITVSLFFTYPQNVDSYVVHHGFNTSAADIAAVRWIEDDAHGEPYIVLANQAVSAAAVREFGFKKYYQCQVSNVPPTPRLWRAGKCQMSGVIFFYPIPTGSPLYQDYLDMVDATPSRAIMLRAMDRVGIDRAYFVLNRYWHDFERIQEEAQNTANHVYTIGGAVVVFAYTR